MEKRGVPDIFITYFILIEDLCLLSSAHSAFDMCWNFVQRSI